MMFHPLWDKTMRNDVMQAFAPLALADRRRGPSVMAAGAKAG
jgi:hypothetical protein